MITCKSSGMIGVMEVGGDKEDVVIGGCEAIKLIRR